MELNTSQPQHSQIVSKPSRNPIIMIVVGALLIGIVLLGLLWWQKDQELQSVNSILKGAQDQIVKLNDSKDSLQGKNTPADPNDTKMSQKDAVLLGASSYYCMIKNFGCDKVAATVTKFQEETETTPGFAMVTASNASSQEGFKLWLEHTPGAPSSYDWVVIYAGQNVPPADIVSRFDIPSSFVNGQ